MKNKDLIAALQQLDPEMEVCILDLLLNESEGDDEDGAGAGIYRDFQVFAMTDEDMAEGSPPFIALSFQDPFATSSDMFQFGADTGRKCRVCGCTDFDCRQCIEKTGGACHWVEEDLCSACHAPNSMTSP